MNVDRYKVVAGIPIKQDFLDRDVTDLMGDRNGSLYLAGRYKAINIILLVFAFIASGLVLYLGVHLLEALAAMGIDKFFAVFFASVISIVAMIITTYVITVKIQSILFVRVMQRYCISQLPKIREYVTDFASYHHKTDKVVSKEMDILCRLAPNPLPLITIVASYYIKDVEHQALLELELNTVTPVALKVRHYEVSKVDRDE